MQPVVVDTISNPHAATGSQEGQGLGLESGKGFSRCTQQQEVRRMIEGSGKV